MMLRYIGWGQAADALEGAIAKTIALGQVTSDLAEQMSGATMLGTRAFGEAIISHLSV